MIDPPNQAKRSISSKIGQMASDMMDLRNKAAELRDKLSPVMGPQEPMNGKATTTVPSKPDDQKSFMEKLEDISDDIKGCDRIIMNIFDRLEL